jgi:hypothetical protein
MSSQAKPMPGAQKGRTSDCRAKQPARLFTAHEEDTLSTRFLNIVCESLRDCSYNFRAIRPQTVAENYKGAAPRLRVTGAEELPRSNSTAELYPNLPVCDGLYLDAGLRWGGLGFSLANVDAALEESAILDADAGAGHVAGESAVGADIHAIRSRNIAADLAQDDDFARGDAGDHLAVAAHRDAVSGKADAALDFAIDKQRLRAGDVALEDQALADSGLLAGDCLRAAGGLKGRRRWRGTSGFRGGNARFGLAGFPHSAQMIPFLSCWNWLPRQGHCSGPKNLNVRAARQFALAVP